MIVGKMKIRRYGFYWADLNPVRGAEIAKTRPVVIVSDNTMNRHLQTVVACPLTTRLHPGWRSRLQVDCGGQPSEIAVDQIRALSKNRLTGEIGLLPEDKAADLREIIVAMYGEG